MESVRTQLDLVQESYLKVASAKNFYTAYRRAAGVRADISELPQFVSLMAELTRTAEELTRKIEERRKRFESVPVLQAMLRFKDGSTRCVVVSKPTDAIDEPYIGEMFHATLVKQGIVASLEDYPILVVDRRKRIVGEISTEKK